MTGNWIDAFAAVPMASEMRDFLDAIAAAGAPAIHELGAKAARENMRARLMLTQLPPSIPVETRDVAGDHFSVRIYRPLDAPSEPLPALIYLHGGGWTIGDIEVFDVLCHDLAATAGIVVVSVDYRLAPEAPFPAGLEDALAALRLVRNVADDFLIDPSRLAIGGDSAGGNLAAVAALIDRDSDAPPLCGQVLIYPATDARGGYGSLVENAEGKLLDSRTMTWFYQNYLGENGLKDDWRISPLLAPNMSALPPALIVTVGHDPLRDEGIAYAQRLAKARNIVRQLHKPDQIHGYLTMSRITREAHATVVEIASFLEERFKV